MDYHDGIDAAVQLADQRGFECSRGQICDIIDAYLAAIKTDAADRIANAARAWGVKIYEYPVDFEDVLETEEEAIERAQETSGGRVVPIALVELKPEELP